jgi:HK97 family phage portal protein
MFTLVGSIDVPPTGSTVVNEYTAMTVPAFWSAVRFISETIAALPKAVYRKVGETRTKADGHWLNPILSRKTSAVSTPFTTFETWIHHATTWGNGYLKLQRDDGGRVVGLLNVNPELVTPFVYEGRKWFYLDVKSIPPEKRVFPDADFLHIAVLGFDGIKGYPIVQLMKQSLEVGKYTLKHTSDSFAKGNFAKGSIELPGSLTAEQAATLKQSLENFKGNGSSAYDFLILQAGAKLNTAQINNDVSQLIQTRQFQVTEVCQMLRVPPHIVYLMSDAKWANVEQMGLEVIKYSLTSWLIKAEQELTAKLLTDSEAEDGYYVRFNVDGLLRGDQASRTSNVIALVNNGLMTPNNGAALLEVPPLGPDGDKLRVPVAVSQPIAEAPKAAAPAEAPVTASAATTAEAFATAAPADPGEAEAAEATATAPEENDAAGADYAAVLEPLLIDAATRVENKTAKAFEKREGKPLGDWAESFASEQAEYAAEAFAPLASAMYSLNKRAIDTRKIGTAYAAEVRRYATTKQKRDLADIAKEIFYG